MSLGVGEGQLAVPPHGPHPWPHWMDVGSGAPPDVGTTRRILIVRTDHVGDLVLSTPFVESLRRGFPRSQITALVTPYTAPVLHGNPSVDEVAVLHGKESEDRASLRRMFKGRAFDMVVALSPTWRSYAIARMIRAPIRAGYIYSRRWVPRALSGIMLTHRAVYHLDALVEKGETVPHEVEQHLWFAHMLGVAAEPVPLRLHPDPEACRQAIALLEDASLAQALEESARAPEWDTASRRDSHWLAVHLAPAWLRAPWSLDAFVELLRALEGAVPDARLAVTFGPHEEAAGRQLRQALGSSERIRVVGGLAFGCWAALLGAARMALSSDTGAVHVAAAGRTPVVVAYEAATYALNSQQWAPWMVSHRKVMKRSPRETVPALAEAAAWLWKPGR